MHIVHVATEFGPIAKAGGLADVVYGLARRHALEGHHVEVVLPHYAFIQFPPSKNSSLHFEARSRKQTVQITQTSLDGITLTLLEATPPLFKRSTPYTSDDLDPFIFFCRAASEYLLHHPHARLLHLHDWPTALIASLTPIPTLLTIHNLQFQGKCTKEQLAHAGICLNNSKRYLDPEDQTSINLLLSGILNTSFITTVSKTYAKEIQTAEHGWWLEKEIRAQSEHLIGITNGIDTDVWNPLTDTHLTHNFSTQATKTDILEAKHHNKWQLQKHLSLPHSHAPMLVSITRLTTQKGPHLILEAAKRALEHDMQFILVGSGASDEMKELFKEIEAHPNGHVEFNYNETLAHQAYASGDAIIIPSLFEPCGLTQLIAMRYGTLPIVRETGGLKDTVTHLKTGFTFQEPEKKALFKALEQFYDTYVEHPSQYEEMLVNALQYPSSWDLPSHQYLEIYEKISSKPYARIAG